MTVAILICVIRCCIPNSAHSLAHSKCFKGESKVSIQMLQVLCTLDTWINKQNKQSRDKVIHIW